MSDYQTEQKAFWAGKFGEGYMGRNRGNALLASKTSFFGRALRASLSIHSVCEFGCNIGLNLKALSEIGNFDLRGSRSTPPRLRKPVHLASPTFPPGRS